MASSLEYVQYAAEQLSEAGEITYRKMFGEYGIYCGGKMFAMVCDDQLFFKITEAGKQMAPELPLVSPYEGAKLCFLVEEIDDRKFVTELARRTCGELPMPKPKKRKKKSR